MLNACFSQLYLCPKLTHTAARIACNSGPTCNFTLGLINITYLLTIQTAHFTKVRNVDEMDLVLLRMPGLGYKHS